MWNKDKARALAQTWVDLRGDGECLIVDSNTLRNRTDGSSFTKAKSTLRQAILAINSPATAQYWSIGLAVNCAYLARLIQSKRISQNTKRQFHRFVSLIRI
jgi:hypothetical protein